MELRKLFTNDIEMLELISDFDVNSVIERIIFVVDKYMTIAIEVIEKITFNEYNESIELFLTEDFNFGIFFVIENINKETNLDNLRLEIVSLKKI